MLSHSIKNFGPWLHENKGHFASREDPSPDSGHRPQNTGRPGKYGTLGNPNERRVMNSEFTRSCSNTAKARRSVRLHGSSSSQWNRVGRVSKLQGAPECRGPRVPGKIKKKQFSRYTVRIRTFGCFCIVTCTKFTTNLENS